MIIHFAFGAVAKTGDLARQAYLFKEMILQPKKLKGSHCEEFLPIVSKPGQLSATAPPVAINGGFQISFHPDTLKPSPPVTLMPVTVCMVCFTSIPFNKLKRSGHDVEYGRLGLAFTPEFIHRHGGRHVAYYDLKGLEKDPRVVAYNATLLQGHSPERSPLAAEMLNYRKPLRRWALFDDFPKYRLTPGQVEAISYSRYPVGYAFSEEREVRVPMTDAEPYLSFAEDDVYALIAPNAAIAADLKAWLQANWANQPKVMTFPV